MWYFLCKLKDFHFRKITFICVFQKSSVLLSKFEIKLFLSHWSAVENSGASKFTALTIQLIINPETKANKQIWCSEMLDVDDMDNFSLFPEQTVMGSGDRAPSQKNSEQKN